LAHAALAGLPLGRAEVRTFNPSPLAALLATAAYALHLNSATAPKPRTAQK